MATDEDRARGITDTTLTLPSGETIPGDRLPCGCKFATHVAPDGEKQMIVQPCSTGCKFYRYAIEESDKQGNRGEQVCTVCNVAVEDVGAHLSTPEHQVAVMLARRPRLN